MKPLQSQESIDSSYSKLLDRDLENEVEDEEEEDESEIDDEDMDFFSKTEAQSEEGRQDWNTEVSHSQNGSSSSGTLGLYSSFDSMIGGSFGESNPDKLYDSSPKFDDISSHLKGALAFGLPRKGSTLRIQKPYKLVGKKNRKIVLFSRPRKTSSARGANAHRSKAEILRKVEMEMERDNIDHLDENLKIAYRIVIELMGESLKAYNSIFMETIELDPAVNGDYLEVVKEPVWLPKIKENIIGQEYKTITEVIYKIRLMLENTFKYFGATHSFSRRGLRLEYILEQKLALLPKEIRSECSIETTHGVTEKDIKESTRTKSSCITVNGEQYFSYLLYKVKGCRQAREKELKKKRWALMRQAKLSKENEVIQWDASLMEGPLGGPVKNMWEVVQINQFLCLSMDILNISQVSQYEMERMLMLPEASLTLRMLMTSLVSSRIQRAKIADKPFMPYSVWAHQLANKTFHWYRVYAKESHNSDKLFDQLGIEPKFWLVCGEQNPFLKKLFHEMTLYQRVWLLKSLCDYIAHTHKSVQEAIAEQPEENMREVVLGKDCLGHEYIYFSQFNGTDVRVYRRKRHKPTYEDLEKGTDGKGKLFTKDQIKAFRKLIKRLKKNQERDEDWENEQRKIKNKLPKKRGRMSGTPSQCSTPAEKRSRPERLRQTPRARYDLYSLESSLDEGDEEEFPKNKGKKISESDSEEEEDRVTDADEEEKGRENTEEILKNQKTKVQKKTAKNILKHFCKTCGKSFKTKVAMFGHTAMHAKKNKKQMSEISEDRKDFAIPQQPESSEDFDKNVIKHEVLDTDNVNIKAEDCSTENFLVKKEIKVEANMKSERSDEENEDQKMNVDEVGKKEVDNCIIDNNLMINKFTNDNPSFEMEQQLSTERFAKMKEDNSTNKDFENVSASKIGDVFSDQDESRKEEAKENEGKDFLDKEDNCLGNTDGSISLSSFKNFSQKPDSKEEAVSRSVSPYDVGDESSIGVPTPAELEFTSPADPDVDEFELVASSFMELRNLIAKFGALPSKYARERIALEEGEEKDEMEEEEVEEKVEEDFSKDTPKPKCEQKLHHSLCKLLIELAPSEGKLNIFNRQTRKKLWNEYLDWSKRDASFMDPAEEAWKSDPEPEPTPSATQTPKQSSSSSSSEDSYNDDGTRKRKLRKRKVKRAPVKPPSPSEMPDVRVPSPVNEPNEDTIVVSSRGRIRKVKRMVNYDRLDFDKLAQQAEKEAEEKKEQKRKKKEEEASREKALQEAAQSLHIPASGVRRYIISKEGEVVGYIGNDGQVHSGPVKVKEQEDASEKYVRQIQPLPIKEKPQQPVESSKIPKVVVSAWNESGTLVYVRMIGSQALELMKLIDASKNDPPRQIKLQRFNQTYTFNTNSYVLTQNIPGYPDSDTSNPQFLSKLSSQNSTTTPAKFSPKETITTPAIQPSHVPQTIVPSPSIPNTPVCSSLNPVALAYKGLPSTTVSSRLDAIRTSTSSTCASLSASTRLVFASPSVVPSAPPITTSNAGGVRLPLSPAATATNNPIIVQTENGQQLQIGLTSERLAQIVQKAGQRVVAVPNDKGGYTISLISAVPQGSPAVKSINNQVRPSGQKSVITQLLPTVASASSGGQQQQLSLLKSRLQQPLVSGMQSQQIVPNYTLNSQVVNSPSVTRQVVIQQHPTVSTADLVSLAQPSHQVVHIAQAPMAQQQQQVYIQQSPQKIVQVVHTAGGGRQLVQMLQPGQMIVTNSNVNPSVSSIQQPSGMVVHSQQGLKQSALLQQQVLVQQSPQPTKIQVAHSQFAQPMQYHQDSTQSKPQHIIIQPQQQYIVHQQQQQSLPTATQQTAQTIVVKSSQSHAGEFAQQQEQTITYTPEQPLTQPLSYPVVSSTPETPGTPALETTLLQQPGETPKGSSSKQVGRIVLLQMNDGQKFYLQLPDGRLSMLTPEQLQPLISSGAIKLSS